MRICWVIGLALLVSNSAFCTGARSGKATEKQILALAEKASSSFCHPSDLNVNGCEFAAGFMKGEWFVFAHPKTRSSDGSYRCCIPDSEHVFFFSPSGVFLREERGGP